MRHVQLRAFHYVAVCGGFSKAAAHLNLSQPAISDQVRRLEDSYDILLFKRDKRNVAITDQGRKLLEITHRLFGVEAQAFEMLNESRTFGDGNLRIIADAAHHITDILRRFRARYPGINVDIRTGNTAEVTTALKAYGADIGVLGGVPARKELLVLHLGASPLVAFCAKSSPHARNTGFTYQQLATLPLVFREAGSKTRQKLEDAALAAGVKLRPAIVAEGREALREIVASSGGVGFVSLAEYGQDARLVRVDLPPPAPQMEESLVCLKERSERRLIRTFMELAKTPADVG